MSDDERLTVGLLLLGARIRELRRTKGLDLAALAERSGLSVQYLSNLEHGRRQPTLQGLVQLGTALGLTPVDLLTGIYPFGAKRAPRSVPLPGDGRMR